MGERRVELGDLVARLAPAALAAAAVDGEVVRSRAPSEAESMRCSIPVIHAGRSHSSRARSPAARITIAARRR